jgi:predicted phosphodiesterase
MSDDKSDIEKAVIEAVSELNNPTHKEVANYVGKANSTTRNHLANLDEIGHEAGKGYYLTGDYFVTDTVSNGYVDEINQDIISDLQNGGLTYGDFARKHDISKTEAQTLLDELERRGYTVNFREIGAGDTRLWYLDTNKNNIFQAGGGDGTYRFGLISDTHIGSSEEHLAELHDFYDRLEERGITTVFHAGDISDGWKVYKHHHQQLKPEAIGWENLREYVVENYPERESIDTYYITGNHDYKLWKRSGIYFGQEIDERRNDLHWLGAMEARIIFHEDAELDLELLHPSGGVPYSLGYKAQKLYRERDPENRPTLGAIGHLHGRMQANAHGVESFYTGCWQGPTPYVKRKGLPTQIGGWIVELEIENGNIRHLGTDWVSYETKEADKSYSTQDLAEL